MLKVKVLLVGPREAGKSVLANFVSESVEGIGSYSPTQGVRILEYEKPNLNGNSKGAGCRFELWDCSGDQKFETCWPALMKDSHGIIIIFNPELPSHLKEIEMWYSCFVQQQPLLDSQCLLVAHHKPGSAGDAENLSLGKKMENSICNSEVFIDLCTSKIVHSLYLIYCKIICGCLYK
uniref:Intraflagellar transport protein 22 homolog n=1 Tax=Strix occidentalis caurina TaxID=311401 RepID=A0A8D0KWJ2_STROC